MQAWLKGLMIRLAAAIVTVASCLACVALPAPRLVWPLLAAVAYPIFFISARWFPIGDLLGSTPPWAIVRSLVVPGLASMPIYVAVFYMPSLGRYLTRLVYRATVRACAEPVTFLIYLVAGAVAGGLAGFWLWSLSPLVGSTIAMLLLVLASGLFLGWVVAVGRCVLSETVRRI